MTEIARPVGALETVHVQVPALAEELGTLRRTVKSDVESERGPGRGLRRPLNGYLTGVKLRLYMWLAQLLETFDDSLVALDDDVFRSSERPEFGAGS